MSTEVRVPTLGESVTEATVATWFKKPGDTVAADEMLCELETDKVTVEVPSPAAGTLGEIVAAEGETVGVDALLATIEEAGASPAPKKKEDKPAEKPAQQPQSNEGKMTDVMVPSLGESVTEATVSTWFKKVGDTVAADEMLCELETDKVSVEVPSPAAGVLKEIVAEEGTTVDASAKLAVIAEGESGGASASAPAKEEAKSEAPAASGKGGKDVEDAPSAKKLMAEKGIDPASVQGSGKDGRIMKEDVAKAENAPKQASVNVASTPSQAPRGPVNADDASREERVKMTRLRQTIARRLKDAQNTAAMLTTYNEVDMGPVMELRKQYKDLFEKKHGVKLGLMSIFVKAAINALKELPSVNAEIYGDEIIYRNYYDIGVAVGGEQGLVVPVLRDADKQSFSQIEGQIADFGQRARDGKLTIKELTGGTFTITNGGIFGSMLSTPILNPPQSGILGMHNIVKRPVVIDDEIVIRPTMYLALSYDHRIIDGREAVTFLVRVKQAIEDPERLLIEV
ncbi:2-oxoglutarate dehydrogenase complex dihydrolipoyllysine-residue succinyltransferase [Thioclava sp. UBA3469]|uniref:2-oxoglutarate dehydrogenase complex dihydrolipoyllysine-residue succinyltransferase n=1 Tax=Thioclava sp. UBA3469 TaxID=1947693 RepID=UPI002580282C|nr:2-oxoglutarate dehydrogenase complex dihydrolipoyllysine-residue succinyltransferase [Thioclava sp. UBA3469]